MENNPFIPVQDQEPNEQPKPQEDKVLSKQSQWRKTQTRIFGGQRGIRDSTIQEETSPQKSESAKIESKEKIVEKSKLPKKDKESEK
jgi:hypothetical protein